MSRRRKRSKNLPPRRTLLSGVIKKKQSITQAARAKKAAKTRKANKKKRKTETMKMKYFQEGVLRQMVPKQIRHLKCIINPKTGRAVSADTYQGERIIKQARKRKKRKTRR